MRYIVRGAIDLDSLPGGGSTKLAVLRAKRSALKEALQEVESHLDGLSRTKCGLTCTGCGRVLGTEEDFAGHFIVARQDIAGGLLNLGSCPSSGR